MYMGIIGVEATCMEEHWKEIVQSAENTIPMCSTTMKLRRSYAVAAITL